MESSLKDEYFFSSTQRQGHKSIGGWGVVGEVGPGPLSEGCLVPPKNVITNHSVYCK